MNCLEWIRRNYRVPAWAGGRVTYTGGAAPQEGINAAMKAGLLKAIHKDGVWYYGLAGLNHNFPLPEGRGWQD